MGQVTRTNFGLVKQRRLTNAQILTLFSAPITLVAARANVMWVPWALFILSQTTAAAYATAATILLKAGSVTWESLTLTLSGLDSGALTLGGNIILDAGTSITQAALPNTALTLTANADPTGGDPANYATVQLYYTAIPTN